MTFVGDVQTDVEPKACLEHSQNHLPWARVGTEKQIAKFNFVFYPSTHGRDTKKTGVACLQPASSLKTNFWVVCTYISYRGLFSPDLYG